MLWPNVKDRFFLCPNCGPTGDAAYEEWVELLAEIPLVRNQWNFSDLLWSTQACPNCGEQLPSAFSQSPAEAWDSHLLTVLEWFALEGKNSYHLGKGGQLRQIGAMMPGYSRGFWRSGFLFEIMAWVAIAVASGVIGNVAYDSVKKAILNARRKALEKRKDGPPRGQDSSALEQYEKYIRPYLQEWDAMSDEDLEKQVRAMYEYANVRLRNVKLRRPQDKGSA